MDYPHGGRTITVRIDRVLDRSARSAFNLALELAEQLDVQSIVVDLDETTDIRASGIGILLILRNEAQPLDVEILLGNCNPKIRAQIDASRLLAGIPHTNYWPGNFKPSAALNAVRWAINPAQAPSVSRRRDTPPHTVRSPCNNHN